MHVPPRSLAGRNFVSRLYLAPMGARHLCMEGEPGGGGGGGGGSGGQGGQGGGAGDPPADPLAKLDPATRTAIETLISARVETATTGLKAKRDELLGESRTLKDNLKKYEGIDPEAVRTILERFGNDEEQQLIKAGKIDEVLAKRTERLQKAHGNELKAKDDALAKEKAKSAKLAQRAVSDAIKSAAIKAGALPEAMEDIVLRAQGAGWTVNDEGDVVATKDGEIVIGKNGKTALEPSEWADELRNAAPHLWPRPQGQGAQGSGGGRGGAAIDPKLPPETRMTLARQASAATRH